MRTHRPFETGDICPSCKKGRVEVTPGKNVVRCTARQGCLFERPLGKVTTSDYHQLISRMDLIIFNQRSVY